MRIAFFSSSVWNYYQRFIPLCDELAKLGNEVIFIDPVVYRGAKSAHLTAQIPLPIPEGVVVIRRQSRLSRGILLALWQNLLNIGEILRLKPDAIVLGEVAFGLLPALLFRFSRIRVVFDYIDDVPEWSEVPWEKWTLRHFLIPLVARLADICVVTSELLGEDLKPHARRIEWVPNGVGGPIAELSDPQLRRGNGVLFLGALAERIDVSFLVELARLLPEVAVTILGDGPPRSRILEAAKSLPNLKAPGAVAHEIGMKAIADSAVCLIPYIPSRLTDRCFPIKLVEYWSLGRAVVATPCHEIRRIGAGALVFVSTAREAADEIRDLIANPERRAGLGSAGLARSREFDYKSLAKRFLSAVGTD